MRRLNGPAGLLLLAVVLVSGCAGPGLQDGTGSEATGPSPILVGGPRSLALTDCGGWRVFADLPGGIGPEDRPPGWPSADVTDAPGIVVQALRCSRISVGPFERGPLHLVLEWHGDARAPAPCREGQPEPGETRVLSNVLVDDPEVAAYLAAEYGLPVLAAEFTEDQTAVGPADLHAWTWRLGSEPSSEVQVPGDAAPAAAPGPNRLFWPSGDGVASLDVAWSGTGSVSRPAHGTFQPPMLLARTADGAFAGASFWLPSLDGQGTFTLYNDTQCSEALP